MRRHGSPVPWPPAKRRWRPCIPPGQVDWAGIRTHAYEGAPVEPRAVVEEVVGTVTPTRAVAAVRAHVGSFFDRWLRGRDDHLLDGPSPEYPEIAFV